MKILSAALAMTLLLPSAAHAAGFLLINHGARATGRGNAYTATAADPSAIWFNPAGITQLDGIQVYAGANLILPKSSFTPDGGDTVDSDTPNAVSPNLYITGRVSDLLTLGLGVNPPYGSTVEWGEDSPGRDIIRKQQLRSWFITPVVAADFSSLGLAGVSFAAGLDLVPASAFLSRDIPFGDTFGTVELSGTAFGVGFRTGLLVHPGGDDTVSLGLMYRHSVNLELEGKTDFDIDPVYRNLLPADGDGSVSLTLPATATAAVAYRITKEIQAEVDVSYVGWTSYDELPITLPDGTVSASARDWEDTFVGRVGVEYSPMPWSVRAGFEYDPTPVPATTLDFTLPDTDRFIVTAGAGMQLPLGFHADLGIWYFLPGKNATSDTPFEPREKGEFEVSAWNLALSVGYAFGGAPEAQSAPVTVESPAAMEQPAQAPAEEAPAEAVAPSETPTPERR